METAHIARDHIASLDDDLLASDILQDDVQGKRRSVMSRLESYIENMPDTVPETQGAAIAQFLPMQTYLGVLNDYEGSAYKRVTVKQRKKDSEADNRTAEQVLAFLKTPVGDRQKVIPPFCEEDVSDRLNTEIEQVHPVQDTETRLDPDDLS